MAVNQVELAKLVKAHYGKALKKQNRDESGAYEVFGSSGQVGFHTDVLCDYPTLIIGRKGSVGEVSWAPRGGWIIDTAYYLEILDSGKLDLRYLFYALRKANLAKKTITTSIPGLNRDDFYETKIPHPPLPEQKRIAAILDKADNLRRKNQQAIHLADKFLRAVFLDMFGDPVTNPKGWKRCKFEDLIEMVTYGLTVRPEYHSEGFPLISAREIRNGIIDFANAPKISEEDFYRLSEKARPKLNDILFSKTGSIGHCAIVDISDKFAVTQNAARIVPDIEKCEPLFLISLLRTRYFFELANREAKGNAVKDLQLGVMKEFPVYAPPIGVQKQFVAIFKRFEITKAINLKTEQEGNNFFNSVSQKAFAGEL